MARGCMAGGVCDWVACVAGEGGMCGWGGGHVWLGRGICVAGEGGMHGWGGEACMAGGVHGYGGCAWLGGMHGVHAPLAYTMAMAYSQ